MALATATDLLRKASLQGTLLQPPPVPKMTPVPTAPAPQQPMIGATAVPTTGVKPTTDTGDVAPATKPLADSAPRYTIGGAAQPRPTVPPPPAIVPQAPPPPSTPSGTPPPSAQPTVPPISVQPPIPQEPEPIDFLTDFGPGDDLRFSQVNPLATERLQGIQGDVGGAQRALSTAPNLGDAAQERLRLLEEQSEPGFQKALQTVGQRASALGRLGAGMTTSELGDVVGNREKYLSQARRGLASDTAFAEGGERRSNLASLSGLEDQVYGQEAGQRGEVRGERGYQADTAQQALDNRIRQRMLEEALLEGSFGRQERRADLGLRGAEQYGQEAEASSGTSADLLQEMAYLEALRNGTALPRRGRTTGAGVEVGEYPG